MANLEGSATITSSSEYSGSYLDDYAADDNNGTEWATAGNGANSWILFTWGSAQTVKEIRIKFRTTGTDYWGIARLTFSDATYTDVLVWDDGSGIDTTIALLYPVTTTSVKVSISPLQYYYGGGVNCGLVEVEIRDSWTTPPSTDLSKPDWIEVISSYSAGYGSYKLVDGGTAEANAWASSGGSSGAWIKYHYNTAVTIESIQLRDRSYDRWGAPRFTFDDNSYEDFDTEVSNTEYTTYTLSAPKETTSLKISIHSGGSDAWGGNRGLVEVKVTGSVAEPPAEGRVLGPAVWCMG